MVRGCAVGTERVHYRLYCFGKMQALEKKSKLMNTKFFCLHLMRAAGVLCMDLDIRKALEEQYSDDLHALTILIISKGNEEQMQSYTDENGNNTLHILLENFEHFDMDWKGVGSCVKTLLDLGIPVTDKNNNGDTVLDKILSSALKFKERAKLTNKLNIANALTHVDAFVECARLLVPKYKGLKQKNSRLLLNLNKYGSYKFGPELLNLHGCLKWIELYQVIVENDVFPINFIHRQSYFPLSSPWQYFFDRNHAISRTNPCIFCKPVTHLFHTAILKGLNVDECGIQFDKLAVVIVSLSTIFRNMENIFDDNLYANDCCYLSMLELLIHCRAADVQCFLKNALHRTSGKDSFFTRIAKMVLNPSVHYSGQPWSLPSPYDPDHLLRFCGVILLYYSDLEDHFLESLNITSHLPEHVPGARQRLLQLKELLKSQRSVKMLSRLCIVDNITHKSCIDELYLPPSLKHCENG